MLACRDTALRTFLAGPSIDQDVHTICQPSVPATASTRGVAHDEADGFGGPPARTRCDRSTPLPWGRLCNRAPQCLAFPMRMGARHGWCARSRRSLQRRGSPGVVGPRRPRCVTDCEPTSPHELVQRHAPYQAVAGLRPTSHHPSSPTINSDGCCSEVVRWSRLHRPTRHRDHLAVHRHPGFASPRPPASCSATTSTWTTRSWSSSARVAVSGPCRWSQDRPGVGPLPSPACQPHLRPSAEPVDRRPRRDDALGAVPGRRRPRRQRRPPPASTPTSSGIRSPTPGWRPAATKAT